MRHAHTHTAPYTMMALLALALMLTACADDNGRAEDITVNGDTGIANPASVYCEEQGGSLEIVETDAGQAGICVKGGMRCDEWAYFRGECSLTPGCGECPQLMPPAPGFCENGTIVPAEPDACGCRGPPSCMQQA